MENDNHFSNEDRSTAPWLDELIQLVARFSDLNIAADLRSMSLVELRALHLFLRRRAEAQQTH